MQTGSRRPPGRRLQRLAASGAARGRWGPKVAETVPTEFDGPGLDAAVAGARKGRRSLAPGLVLPAVILLLLVFAYPTAIMFSRSVTDATRSGGSWLDNYRWFFDSEANRTILMRTFTTALRVTVLCLAVGYPYAYVMTLVSKRWRTLMIALVLIPFWTSTVVRSYAWIVLLQPQGVVRSALRSVGMDVGLLRNTIGVTIGMVHILLPFMVLSLFSSMRNIDRRLIRAAQIHGASPAVAHRTIYLPLATPGIIAGCLLVFVLSLGFFITPALLGSPQQSLLSQLIVKQLIGTGALQWGRAGAMAAILVTLTLVILGATSLLRRGRGTGIAGVASEAGAGLAADIGESRAARVKLADVPLRAFAAVVAVGLVLPTLVVIPMSFTGQRSFVFPPSSWSTRWFHTLVEDPRWRESLFTSIRVGLMVTVVATVVGSMAALGLMRIRRRWASGPINALLLAPMTMPVVVLAIGIYWVFLQLGLTGKTTGFVLAHSVIAVPFVVVSVGVSLKSFDWQQERAASSLGAGPLARFFLVTLPQILPGVASGALLAFVASLDEVVISMFLSSSRIQTMPVQMYNSVTREINPTVAAASTVIFLGTVVLFVLSQIAQRRGWRSNAA